MLSLLVLRLLQASRLPFSFLLLIFPKALVRESANPERDTKPKEESNYDALKQHHFNIVLGNQDCISRQPFSRVTNIASGPTPQEVQIQANTLNHLT